MGAADIHLHEHFRRTTGGQELPKDFDIYQFLTQPSLFDPMTRQFTRDLDRIHSSWSGSDDWPYAGVVRAAHTLIDQDCRRKDGTSKLDLSGVPIFMHCLAVADDAFRLAKMFGFSDHEATTVWLAGLCHDYLEGAKGDPVRLVDRTQKMGALFNSHDNDVTNLAIMLSKTDPAMPYLVYSGHIGCLDGFSDVSTEKAQFAAWLIKFCDSSHNRRPDRNQFLDTMREEAQALRDQGQILNAQVLEEKIESKFNKLRMYDLNIALMAAKMGRRVPADTTMIDFVVGPLGKKFRDPKSRYDSALRVGLGDDQYLMLGLRLLEMSKQAANENTAPTTSLRRIPAAPTPPAAA